MRSERKLFFWCGIFTSGGAVKKDWIEVLQLLKPGFEIWLIVDINKDDFEQISGSSELAAFFNKVMYLTEDEAKAPGVFDLIIGEACASMMECLVFDHNLRRAVASINHRLPAAIILGSEHLYREFLLRKLTEQEYVMHKRPV